MRNVNNIFHIAIPAKDLDSTYEFYVEKLGCKLARRYSDRLTLDFFGDQLVCHLAPGKIMNVVELYPRHFGITFRERWEFDNLVKLCESRKIAFYKTPFLRFENLVEEHWSFFIVDPSNNVLEFKYYEDPHMMY